MCDDKNLKTLPLVVACSSCHVKLLTLSLQDDTVTREKSGLRIGKSSVDFPSLDGEDETDG